MSGVPMVRGVSVRALSLVAVVALSACSSSDDPAAPEEPVRDLTGSWIRVNSSFAELNGMVVLVGGDESDGVITSTPSNVYMFQSGDVKWRSISRSAEGDYDFEDLIRAASTGDTSYIAGRLLVSSGGDSLTATFPTSATVQQWTRND